MTGAVLPNSIPIGSTVRVSLLGDASRSITVTVTDNGMVNYPASRAAGQWVQDARTAGRIIDLTPAAFKALGGSLSAGTMGVKAQVLTIPDRVRYFPPPR